MLLGGMVAFEVWNMLRGNSGAMRLLVLLALVTVVGGLVGFVRYWNFRFKLNEQTIHLRRGVIGKTSVELPIERIQTINVRRRFLDRLFNLETLTLDSAGSAGVEVVLPSVPRGVADAIRGAVLGTDRNTSETPEPNPDLPHRHVLATLGFSDLVRL